MGSTPRCWTTAALAALALLSSSLVDSELLGDAFQLCSRSDPSLDQCVMDSINGARDRLGEGIPELALPPLRNHFIDHILVEEGPQELSMRVTTKNMTVVGFEDFAVTRAKLDLETPSVEFETIFPKVNGSGLYKWNGALLTLRIRGDGPYDVYMGNVNMTHHIDFEEYQKDGSTYWRIKNYNLLVDWDDYHADLKNLFNGNRRLGQYVNRFINRNMKLIMAVYGQTISNAMADYMTSLLSPFFERVPVDKMFAP